MRFKKKKVVKYRGSKTHGGGAMKKRRGAGNRGGRGRAGSGKKGDSKKPSYWKKKSGKRGFTSKSRKKIKAINLEVIHNNLNSWLEKGIIVKKPTGYELELKKLGYNKLLGKGNVKVKLNIITGFASKKAIEKIKKAGGDVKVLYKKVEKVKKEKVKKEEKKSQKSKISGKLETTSQTEEEKEEQKEKKVEVKKEEVKKEVKEPEK